MERVSSFRSRRQKMRFREKFFAFLLVVVGVVRGAFNQTQTTISAKKQARRARRLVDAWR